LFKQIQDCVDFAEAGGVAIGAAQKLTFAYSKIFKSGKFNSACRRWDENWKLTRLGIISRFILLLLTASTDRRRERHLEPKDLTMQQSLKRSK
jgi:hypothetical protein